ncbi:DUF1684 domain-containing protein [Streptomyces sp. NBC_01218]|uniref:DUF1684 domain-containing protein n=1 Tax=unclassified Streptomyces TaxID=2593676 RepID=UPI0023B9837F|nr:MULTISPECIES: DUF1684 domain-containing protein [unclassified Streptomyces]WEH38211.1 DUF1684 domain-containing protein [Streptomyces sp. AM 2-1-1]WSQ49872.1 DUF1684 domain-containing protein [Streptomyces sp. NBC_01218]
MTVPETAQGTFVEEWEAWHRQKEETLAGPHGFLAITSLHWLSAEPERFADAPGAWSTSADGVVVDLADGEELILDGVTLTGRHHFGVLGERTSLFPGYGDAVIEVAKRGGHDILRPRHPENVLRTGFTRTPVYAPDTRWVRPGRFVPFEQPRPVTVGASVEGLEHVYDSPGEVEFELAGEVHRLTTFNGTRPGSLMALFTDRTSGVTTYAANRSLQIAAPDEDGAVVVDFNRAGNLPCAYTDLATCPLPPKENRLPVAVEAGERIPLERGGQP